MKLNKLDTEEERVILYKGTEPPFSGIYDDFKKKGTFRCKRCDSPLFRSEDKFPSHCGWPSFDEAIPVAVKSFLDPDGVRTEITCANCGAHLGHVFVDEKLTRKNVRYCINSIAMNFQPKDRTEKAIFAGGCFWGIEQYFKDVPGVVKTTVGYTGGIVTDPAHNQVSSGKTGHAESIEIVYDPRRVSYEDLAKVFFEIHDPTQLNRQGADVGSQYRSAIFYLDKEQKRITDKLISELKKKGLKIMTAVEKADRFYAAEDYHQRYYEKIGKPAYCQPRIPRF